MLAKERNVCWQDCNCSDLFIVILPLFLPRLVLMPSVWTFSPKHKWYSLWKWKVEHLLFVGHILLVEHILLVGKKSWENLPVAQQVIPPPPPQGVDHGLPQILTGGCSWTCNFFSNGIPPICLFFEKRYHKNVPFQSQIRPVKKKLASIQNSNHSKSENVWSSSAGSAWPLPRKLHHESHLPHRWTRRRRNGYNVPSHRITSTYVSAVTAAAAGR